MPQLYRWDYRQENVDYGVEKQNFADGHIKKHHRDQISISNINLRFSDLDEILGNK